MDTDRAGPARLLSPWGWLGVVLGAAGAVLLFLGWWGVSGESVLALQLPYLVSASIPGGALVVAGGVLLAGESARRDAAHSARMVATLYDLLTTASTAPPPVGASTGAGDDLAAQVVMVPGGNRYHRRECVLADDKPGTVTVDAAAIAEHGLRPCPICSPAPPAPAT